MSNTDAAQKMEDFFPQVIFQMGKITADLEGSESGGFVYSFLFFSFFFNISLGFLSFF